jgi:hypothetical protein
MYRTTILPVALYRCEALSLAQREDHTLRMFENRVLWEYNEEHYNFYDSLNIIRVIK